MVILIALFGPLFVVGTITYVITRRHRPINGVPAETPPSEMPADLLQELSRDAWRSPGEHRVPPPGE